MTLNTYIPSLTTQRYLHRAGRSSQLAMGRLSSGLRLNSAADDASGLAMAEQLRNQISGLNQAIRNTQDGISLIQVAEAATDEMHAMLARVRELTVRGASDGTTAEQRSLIAMEINQMLEGIQHLVDRTQFNGMYLLRGQSALAQNSLREVKPPTHVVITHYLHQIEGMGQGEARTPDLQTLLNSFALNEEMLMSFFSYRSYLPHEVPQEIRDRNPYHLHFFHVTFDREGFRQYVEDQLYDQVLRHFPGATLNQAGEDLLDRLTNWSMVYIGTEDLNNPGTVWIGSMNATNNYINTWGRQSMQDMMEELYLNLGTNMVETTPPSPPVDPEHEVGVTPGPGQPEPGQPAPPGGGGNLPGYGLFLSLQTGANSGQRTNMVLHALGLEQLGLETFADQFEQRLSDGVGLSHLLDDLDQGIGHVSEMRATLGAIHNRLERTIHSLGVSSQNLLEARSRVTDTDFVKEYRRLAGVHVLQVSGIILLQQMRIGLEQRAEHLSTHLKGSEEV